MSYSRDGDGEYKDLWMDTEIAMPRDGKAHSSCREDSTRFSVSFMSQNETGAQYLHGDAETEQADQDEYGRMDMTGDR